MADTNTNAENAPAPGADDLEKVRRALEAEREERKSDRTKHGAFRATVAKALGLPEDTAPDAVLARLGESDTERIVTDRTAALAKERDDFKARAEKVESDWNSQRIEAALTAAFDKSGARPENREDYLSIARSLFTVDEAGQVKTRTDAPNTVPGVDPSTWIVAELRTKRPHWWPLSQGGNARGSRGEPNPNGLPGDPSVFDKSSRSFSVTGQGAYYRRWGPDATARAQEKYR